MSNINSKSYINNRVLLAGDSAHAFPPAGGFGMCTGIEDVQNLAYKFLRLKKDNNYKDILL